MGYETTCHARVIDERGTREAESKVLLETDHLIVRGDARVRIPRRSIQKLATRAGVLTITSPAATVLLTLGAEAAVAWRKKLEQAPKRLIDKLDVKPGAAVWMMGDHDETLIAQLRERTESVSAARNGTACDVAFVAVESVAHLDRIDIAAVAIKDSGAVWVTHRKGPAGVADTTIFARAKLLGLAYVKVARVSDTHTAEKLVRPRAARARQRAAAP